jgi:hypothetical protein
MMLKKRRAVMSGLGLVLIVGLWGFAVTPAQALSISGTYTDIAFGSAGTGGSTFGLQTGLVGGLGSSLVNGFPFIGTLGNNFWSPGMGGISSDGFGTRVDNATVFSVTGNHTLNLFFADIHVEGSGITFSCDGCVDPTSTALEPATLVLFGTTLVGLGAVIRRHLKGGKKVP